MNQKLISALKLAISLGIGLLLIWLVYSKLTPQDKTEIMDAFRRANYWWIVASVFLGLLSHISRAFRWKMLIEPLGYKPRISNTFFAVMIMYIANLAFFRAGDVMRCGIMARYEKVPFQKALGTMVTERAFDLLSLALVGVLVIIFQYGVLRDYLFENVTALQTVLESNMYLIGGVIVLAILSAAVGLVIAKRSNAVFIQKIRRIVKGLFDGVISVRNVKSPVAFVLHSIFIWAMYFAMITVAFFALPETSTLGIVQGMACLFFGSFAIIAVQGGIGAYPLVISKLLLIYGVTENIGYAFGWIAWTGQTALVVLGGLTSLILLSVLNKKEPSNELYQEHSIQNT